MGHAGLVAVAALVATANLVACGKSSHSSSADGCEGGAGGDSTGGTGGSAPEEVPEELVSLPHAASCPTSLAVDESALFWIGANADGAIEVARAPKHGGEPQRLAQLPAPIAKGPPYVIAVDEDSVYFAGADSDGLKQVLAVGKTGGDTRVVAAFGAVGLLVDSLAVFIGSAGAVTPGIYAVTAEAPDPVHVGGTEDGVYRELSSDGSHLYWTSASTLFRVPKAGGSASVVTDSVASYPGVSAADSHDVYWADADGWLKRAPVDGGAATRLAEFRADSLEVRERTAYAIGSRDGVTNFVRAKAESNAEFVRGPFVGTALALDDEFAYFARCEYVCLINGAPADCPDHENNATLVRLPLR